MGGFYNTPSNSPASLASVGPINCIPAAPVLMEKYRNDPYDIQFARTDLLPMEPEYFYENNMAPSTLPEGTLHLELEGRVSFVPYPTEKFELPVTPVPETEDMARIFLGQLPYQVADMQLDWLVYTFGNGATVYHPERITKFDNVRGCKVPTGCIHGYAANDVVAQMLNSMHKRILVDDTGVWVAETNEQQALLNDYCHGMKVDRTRRFQNRPYDTVVAQFATSSYAPTPKRR